MNLKEAVSFLFSISRWKTNKGGSKSQQQYPHRSESVSWQRFWFYLARFYWDDELSVTLIRLPKTRFKTTFWCPNLWLSTILQCSASGMNSHNSHLLQNAAVCNNTLHPELTFSIWSHLRISPTLSFRSFRFISLEDAHRSGRSLAAMYQCSGSRLLCSSPKGVIVLGVQQAVSSTQQHHCG